MSASYSPTAEFTDSTTVLADGDAASATNLNAAPKKALDRAAYLRAATDGLLVWERKARVAAGGDSSASTGVYCPAIEAVALLDGSTWKAFSLASETQLTVATHAGGVALTADTWYYVYAYVSGGALALQISADAPGADGIWKSGATSTHRYLFCFRTGTGTTVLPMTMRSGVYRYDLSEQSASVLQVLNITSAVPTSWTNIDCSARIPPRAVLGTFRIEMINADATNWGRTELRKDGATTDLMQVDCPPAGAAHSAYHREQFDLQTSSAQVIEYQRISSASYANCDIIVSALGFTE